VNRISSYAVLILLRRVVLVWVFEVAGLWLLARLLPGLHVQSVPTAAWAVVVIALLNAVVRPLIILLTLPFTVLSFGFFILVLNAAILVLASRIVHGLHVDGWFAATVAAFGLTVINTVLTSIFSLNDEDSVYRNIVKRIAGRSVPREQQDRPGLMIIEIDGLSAPVLEAALSKGYMPTLEGWLRRGSHKLSGWDCGFPSQTSSSQAGILCGNNFDIPAFRWFEKETGRLMVSNNPNDAAEIERRVSSGEGLLRDGGFSLGNLISGDAPRSLLTMSSVLNPARHMREGYGDLFLYQLNPYHFARGLTLSLWELLVELWQGARQRIAGVQPRVPRGGSFPLLRAISTGLLREASASLLIGEMFAGARVAYASFVGYDVVAHHAGPARRDALAQLRGIDGKLALIARAAEDAPRPYYFVVLSDHGQSFGATFKQRFGVTLEQHVQSLLAGEETVRAYVGYGEGWGHLNTLLSEAVKQQGMAGRAVRRMFRRRTHDGYVNVKPEALTGEGVRDPESAANVVVCASGNLGLVYFADRPGRLSFETMAVEFPNLIEGLVGHPGVGFVLVWSEQHGPLVLGKDGIRYLSGDRVEGQDPLAQFGTRAAEHLRRFDTFPHAGDLVINSMCDPHTSEVAAFEELVGSHGGMGGPQTEPFILYPAAWADEELKINDSTEVYWLLRRWKNQLS
jgi:putative membrane protein